MVISEKEREVGTTGLRKDFQKFALYSARLHALANCLGSAEKALADITAVAPKTVCFLSTNIVYFPFDSG